MATKGNNQGKSSPYYKNTNIALHICMLDVLMLDFMFKEECISHCTKFYCLSIYCPPKIIVLFVSILKHIPSSALPFILRFFCWFLVKSQMPLCFAAIGFFYNYLACGGGKLFLQFFNFCCILWRVVEDLFFLIKCKISCSPKVK